MRSTLSRAAVFFTVALITCIVIAAIAITRPAAPAHASGSFSWSASGDTTVPSWDNMDIRPMLVTNGANFYVEYGNGISVNRWLCTSMDTCTAQANGTLDSSFPTAQGAKVWLGGAILNGSTYYAIAHIEFAYNSTPAPNFNWFRRIGLATSTNQGLTWHYAGDIVTSNLSTTIADYAGATDFQAGPGDVSIYADWSHGYLYVYYTTFWADQTTGARTEQTNVARCPISSIASISCWHKFYNGAWNEPGIGGHNSPVWSGEDNAAVSWDSYLNAYIAIGHSTSNVSFITTATSMDSQNWQPVQPFVASNELYWYNFVVATNADPFTLGQQFRVYSAENDYQGTQTKYFTVSLSVP